MTKEGEGAGSALVNVLKHPITIGALGGGAIGAGLGYLAPEEKELRARSALVGAGTGAALGGLGGALASAGMTPEEVQSEALRANAAGMVRGHQIGLAAGHKAGREQIIKDWPTGVPLNEATKIEMLKKLLG